MKSINAKACGFHHVKEKKRFRKLTYSLVGYAGHEFRDCRFKYFFIISDLGSNKRLEDLKKKC